MDVIPSSKFLSGAYMYIYMQVHMHACRQACRHVQLQCLFLKYMYTYCLSMMQGGNAPCQPPKQTLYMYVDVHVIYMYMYSSSQESLHSVGNWKHEMERYNVGPRRRHSVWMMAGHKITDQDYTGFISQANVRGSMP